MKLDYKVHSVSRDKAPMSATVNGVKRDVEMEVLTVELVGEGSALTFRFEDADDAEKLFAKPGKKITLTFAGAK